MDSCETSSQIVLEMDKSTSKILDKVNVLDIEKGRVMKRFGFLNILITSKLSILKAHLTEMEKIGDSMTNSISTELKAAKTTSYALNGQIHFSELLIKSWNDEVKTLEDSFQDILKLVSKH